jgi:hypothetical protein
MLIRKPVFWLALTGGALSAGCQPSVEELAAQHAATIDRYCLDCHDYAQQEAGLSLERADLVNVAENADVWEEVARKLRGRQMPPPGNPRPEAEAYDSFVAYLESSLDAAAAANPNPGPASIHRLNRTEYGNAVRDLLAVEIDAAEFLPADDEAYGFDNIADVLRVSPSLLEQYLSAATKISALAVGDPATPPITSVYRAPSDLSQAEHIDGLPLGTRGGIRIEHTFPLDAEYDFNVFLLRNIVGYMTGLEWPHELEIAIDGERIFHAQVGGPEDNAASDANFAAAANAIDERLRIRKFVTAGPHEVSVAFIDKSSAETHEPLEVHTRNLDLQDMNGLPVVDYVNISGPYNPRGISSTPSRERIFTCRPASAAAEDETFCATEILTDIAHRAYRRPVTEQDLQLLLEFYRSGRARGGFETGIQNAIRVVLTSPAFLYRSEPDPSGVTPGTAYELSDLQLASRLAFFLWSSLPDDELLSLAEEQKLSDPRELERQVRRMLADPRAEALIENFAGQWLFLRNLQSVRPDVEQFPNFDDNLRQAMRRETELLFGSIISEDRSVLDLLNADYTFLNHRLAEHYGVPNVYGSHFRRVPVPDEMLTVTSYPNRTSPVLRGKWVMENVLGTPPPAPPPNVPSLEENQAGQAARSVRERLEEHRANPVCASCHDVMDPIGLGLENFDAVGRWRTREPGGVVDASGQMVDGTPIDGPVSLRAAVTAAPEQFAGVVTEKLMIYALGRGLEAYDMPTVRKIVRTAAEDDFRFSSIILGVVNSTPFRMRIAQPLTTAAADSTEP